MLGWNQIVLQLLLPPANLILILAVGLFGHRRYPKLARISGAIGLALLYLFSLTPVALGLLGSLDIDSPLDPEALRQKKAQAIVVLGSGPRVEDGKPVLGAGSRVRANHGALRHRETSLPVLVCGGDRLLGSTDAELMKSFLEEMAVEPVWTEDNSINTYQNALFATPILKNQKAQKIVLVTHFTHMRRAKSCFEGQGFEVIPSPVGSYHWGQWSRGVAALVPRADALSWSSEALGEWLAILWYRLRY